MSYLLGIHIPRGQSGEARCNTSVPVHMCPLCLYLAPRTAIANHSVSAGVRSHPSPAALSHKCPDEWRGIGQVTLELSYWVFLNRKDL